MKTLTPLDTPIYDDLVIEDLEKRWGESLTCFEGDGEIAIARVACKRCGASEQMCARHTEWVTRRLATNNRVYCRKCGADAPARDLMRVVPL